MGDTLRKVPLCQFLTLWRLLVVIVVSILLLAVIFVCKSYILLLLEWLQDQEPIPVALTITFLYVIVSLPISIGYFVLVLTEGYLFGFVYGSLAVIVGANVGLFVAHNGLKALAHNGTVVRYTQSNVAQAILGVVGGPSAFKIVFCSRLTPIPFGLQNVIFALSKVNGKVYHMASFLGLMPAQFLGVYIGTTLKTMQDVIDMDNNGISSLTGALIASQLVLAICLMVWFGARARSELLKAISGAEMNNKLAAGFNIV